MEDRTQCVGVRSQRAEEAKQTTGSCKDIQPISMSLKNCRASNDMQQTAQTTSHRELFHIGVQGVPSARRGLDKQVNTQSEYADAGEPRNTQGGREGQSLVTQPCYQLSNGLIIEAPRTV
ncbi:TPA: hypothetical protein ACH3X1_011964 [Trebouxia sp. C0004]